MSVRKKGPLSAKAIAAAAPIEKKPYALTRRYGETVLMAGKQQVRTLIRADLENLEEMGKHWSTLNLLGIRDAREQLVRWTGGDLNIEFEFDTHSGVKYSVEVIDRLVPGLWAS